MSPIEMHVITTLHNQYSLEHLVQLMSLDLQGSNLLRAWRMKHVLEKFKKTGIIFGHMWDFT